MQKPSIVVLASGEVAVPTIQKLMKADSVDLIKIVTQPDRPVGRKRRLTPTPVGQFCEQHRLEAEKPESVNDPSFINRLLNWNCDAILLFAFGQILGREILQTPRCGCINIHTSLLPKYRGASPIQAAILNGDTVTGVSFVQMVRKLDAGPVYAQVQLSLDGSETAQQLESVLADLAAEHVLDVVNDVIGGTQVPREQNHEDATFVTKITKDEGKIDWNRSAQDIHRQVRAYFPWPGAWFVLDTQKKRRTLTVTDAACIESDHSCAAGTIVQADKKGFHVQCGQDTLNILKVVPDGKKEMSATDFLMGTPLDIGTIL